MKVAMCFNGKIGGLHTQKKGNLAHQDAKVFRESIKTFENNIFNSNIDIEFHNFLHCWDPEHQDELVSALSPKDFLFEKEWQYDQHNIGRHVKGSVGKKYSIFNKWKSVEKSLKMMFKYAKKNNIEYDYIMLCRYDTSFLSPLMFSDLKRDTLYAINWFVYKEPATGKKVDDKIFCSKKWRENNQFSSLTQVGFPIDNTGFFDLWFIGGHKIMTNFMLIYTRLNELAKVQETTDNSGNFSNHRLIPLSLSKDGHLDNMKFILDFPKDCCHTRYIIN